MQTARIYATLFFLVSGLASASGQGRPPEVLSFRTERVVVFKDGYSLFVKRGLATTDENGAVSTTEVPDAAVLGSFWAVPTEGELLAMVAGTTTETASTTRSTPCSDTIDVLRANQGSRVHVELGRDRRLTGVIGDVLVETTMRPLPAPATGWIDRSAQVEEVSGSLFVLETEEGDVLLPVDNVTRLRTRELETVCEEQILTSRTKKRLEFRFAEAGQERELLVMYFVPDLRWIPTYRAQLPAVEVTSDARLMLQAEILNEREDLVDVPLDLVVGVPHFRFKDTVSPFSLEATIRSALAQVAPQLMAQQVSLSNASFRARSSEHARAVAAEPDAGTGIDLSADLSGEGSHDLFFYSVSALTLKKGERAAVPLFSASVPWQSLYTWDLRLKRAALPMSSPRRAPLELSLNDVWHQLVLTNTTHLPWTTGPLLMLQDYRPLAQELLTYTPAGGAVRIPVTVSVDTRGTFREEEIGRTLEALTVSGDEYARVDQRGILTLTSSKPEPVDVEVRYGLGGRVDEVSHGGATTGNAYDPADWQSYRGSPDVNVHSDVVWRVRLQPGESVELMVRYHYYVLH